MDKDILVAEGQKLVQLLDQSKIRPRGAMWVYTSETDSWKLWVVPSKDVTDKSEFYRIVSETISKARDQIPTMDVSTVEMKLDNHPAVAGLGNFISMPGIGSAQFSNNRFNGFFLPDGVVLRMAL